MLPLSLISALLILGLGSPLASATDRSNVDVIVDEAPSATPETPDEQHQASVAREYQLALATRLAADPDPRRKMAAAYFLKATERADAYREQSGLDKVAAFYGTNVPLIDADALVRDALRQGWDDPLLLWMAVADCPASVAACNAPAALARLREIEPKNAANWLFSTMAEGDDPSDTPAAQAGHVERRLTAIAESTHLNMHTADLLRLFLDATSVMQVPESVLAIVEPPESNPKLVQVTYAAGMSIAIAWPSLGALSTHCDTDHLEQYGDARRERCLAAMRFLHRHADTLLVDAYATKTLIRLLPEGAERDALLQAQRNRRWQQAAAAELMQGADDGSNVDNTRAQLDDFLKLVNDPEATEISHLQDRLVEAGVPLKAPSDWTAQ